MARHEYDQELPNRLPTVVPRVAYDVGIMEAGLK